MKLSARTLLVIAVIAALVGFTVIGVVYEIERYILRIALIPMVVLAVVSVVVAALGWRLRRMVRRAEPIDALGATTTLAAGQTCAVAGSVGLGFSSGALVVILPLSGSPSGQEDLIVYGISALLAAVSIAAGLFTQWCCQVPPEDDGTTPSAPADRAV